MKLRPIATGLVLALPLAACLDNEEEITVHPDGGVTVRVSAKGQPQDLTEGYPVPLVAPWVPGGGETDRWIRTVGGDTGSVAARARFDPEAWGDDDVRLEATAEFASVEAWTQSWIPASEPYPGAYLRRSASLSVEPKGGRTVYTFERVYHGRSPVGWGGWEDRKLELPDEIGDKVNDEIPLTPEEWQVVIDTVRRHFNGGTEAFARDALAAVYTEGEASLPVDGFERVLASVRSAVAALVTQERLEAIIAEFRALDRGEVERDGPDPFTRLEDEARQTLRRSLTDALVREHVPDETRHAIHERLEWNLTAKNHLDDLSDEKFTVIVHLPGRIVAGNYDEVDGTAALWFFDGEELTRDVRMRAVAVRE